MKGPQFRYLMPLALISICLVALSAITAISLFGQQASVNRVLRENVQSQRAAIELEECLNDLIALEDEKVRSVTVMHGRVTQLLDQVLQVADQPAEQALHTRMSDGFRNYLTHWNGLPDAADLSYDEARKAATRTLEQDVLKPCQEFEAYNTERVGDSAEHHERVLRQLAWGMAGVGIFGGVAGLVLGYGVARGLARSIRRLQVQIRDAAGKLAPHLPDIVFTETGDFGGLHAQIEHLQERIEGVVRELQAREREVLRAEQLAAVGQLAAGVAHEIRNPLTSIKMLAQAAQQDGTPISNDDLRVIESEVRRMEHSLNTFLDFARSPKPQRSRIEVTQLLHDVSGLLRMRAERQGVHLEIQAPEANAVWADPEQLRQVFVNLGLNALDSMPNGGRLSVDVAGRGRELDITVRDTGAGIPATVLPRLFTPFVSSKDTGLGLGLVISRRIIEDHGGTLTAANGPEGGAEFLVRLPLEAA